MNRTTQRNLSMLGALLVGAVGVFSLLLPMTQALVERSYDLTVLTQRSIQPTGVCIVYMDLESHHRLGQDPGRRWDRGLHARLIDRLRDLGARAVVFDVVFVTTTNEAAGDDELAEAAHAHGKVAVAALVVPDDGPGGSSWRLIKPFPGLAAVTSWGVAEVGDANGWARQHNYRRDFGVPSLALRAMELTEPSVHRDPYRERWMYYYGPPGMLPHYSYWEVLSSNAIPMTAFSNQVVFVGARYEIGMAGGKGVDEFLTPYTSLTGQRSPGVEVVATAYLNLARNDALHRFPTWLESLLIAGAGTLATWGLIRLRPWPAAAAVALSIVVVAVLSMGMTGVTGTWFPWLVIAVVQLPAALGWSLLTSAGRAHEQPLRTEMRTAFELSGDDERRIRRELDQRRDASPCARSDRQCAENATATDSAGQTATNADLELEPKQIADHHLLRCIGKGAYGEVWLARSVIGIYHAVKLVHRDRFPDEAPYEREFKGIKRFTPISGHHPGFVQVLHVGRNDAGRFIYYVMEAADDEVGERQFDPRTYSPRTLAKELQRRRRLPLKECLRLGESLADALDVLHFHQLIHRDIKPANIIFVNGAPKLADIGLVTEAADPGAVTYLGTKGYIAPEGPGTSAGDIYSLGKVLYEASVGLDVTHFPELPTAISAASPDDPFFKLNAIVLKACETNPAQRHVSAASLRDALRDLLGALENAKTDRAQP